MEHTALNIRERERERIEREREREREGERISLVFLRQWIINVSAVNCCGDAAALSGCYKRDKSANTHTHTHTHTQT